MTSDPADTLFHMALCEDQPCASEGRWIGDDDKVRCSMHQIQRYGHGAPLVRVEGYTPPRSPDDTPAETPAETPA